MNNILKLSNSERANLFEETAARMGIGSPIIVEKDFWVCWVLNILFSGSGQIWPKLLFKGGTSLSKAYGLIQRFSEDIDLSIHRDTFGFIDDDELAQQSASSRKKILASLQTQGGKFISSQLFPKLDEEFSKHLSVVGGDWELVVGETNGNPDPFKLVFRYPKSLAPSSYIVGAYIAPSVILEFGVRSDAWPAESKSVVPYVVETFPDLFSGEAKVWVLGAERTFWEKATILHAEYHRNLETSIPERQSRHYYDLVILAGSEYGARALADTSLLEAVANHKALFFSSSWAKYDEARPGTLRLNPKPERVSDIRRDYEGTKEMLFGPIPEFDQLLESIEILEHRINMK